MEKTNTRKEKIFLILAVYTFGLLLGLSFCLLRILGRIKITHKERFPKKEKGILVVSNHPSLLEPILLPLLFFGQYIFHPFSFTPWSIPDKANYFDRWYWFWAKITLIPINRNKPREAVKSLQKIEQILKDGRPVILFPEGGRTSSEKEHFTSKNGKKLRKLKGGVGRLVFRVNPLILPIWVDGAENVLPNKQGKLYHCFPRLWRIVKIRIGEPFRCTGLEKEKITQEITWKLFELADEE